MLSLFYFSGDIYLFRVKDSPVSGNMELPEDYGLYSLTSGKVHVKYYDGQHSSLLTGEFMSPLVVDLNDLILGLDSAGARLV